MDAKRVLGRRQPYTHALILAVLLATPLLTACGSSSSGVSAGSLRRYLAQVEPIRLGVNQLLTEADPILSAFHDHTMSGQAASAAMDRLERSFAASAIAVAAIRGPLASINAPYAHTFVLEDAYLSALVADLPDGDFDNLPNTQNEQRAAIIEWRIRLEVLSARLHVALPPDLQQAGRGEIAPSVSGS